MNVSIYVKSPMSVVSVFPTRSFLGNPVVSQETAVGKTLKMPMLAIFCTFFASYRPHSGNLSSVSCRGDHKLRNEWSYIKIC